MTIPSHMIHRMGAKKGQYMTLTMVGDRIIVSKDVEIKRKELKEIKKHAAMLDEALDGPEPEDDFTSMIRDGPARIPGKAAERDSEEYRRRRRDKLNLE